MKILVVDDVGCVRHLVQHRLSERGLSVVTAGTGSEALTMLRSDPSIQVVISDLVMPIMDGVDLFRAAQKLDRFNDQGIAPPPDFFLMTALRSSATIAKRDSARLSEAEALGVIEVLQKPIDFEYLFARLADLKKKTGTAPAGRVAPAPAVPAPVSAKEATRASSGPLLPDGRSMAAADLEHNSEIHANAQSALMETRSYLANQLQRIDTMLSELTTAK